MESIAQNWLKGFPGDCLQFVAVCLIKAEDGREQGEQHRAGLGRGWDSSGRARLEAEGAGKGGASSFPTDLASYSWAQLGWLKAILATCPCHLPSFEASPAGLTANPSGAWS